MIKIHQHQQDKNNDYKKMLSNHCYAEDKSYLSSIQITVSIRS